jgi:hypothetical protein
MDQSPHPELVSNSTSYRLLDSNSQGKICDFSSSSCSQFFFCGPRKGKFNESQEEIACWFMVNGLEKEKKKEKNNIKLSTNFMATRFRPDDERNAKWVL